MLSLKKYFTEGLIQFTILLSLIGVRVDVDNYLNPRLPHLREIILGPSSAYTQTQFHNLRNTLQGYDVHPKSVDLDDFFTTRRLLGQVRALDRLQVPSAEVDAWLVHREPESSVSSSQPNPVISIDSAVGLQEVSSLESAVRDNNSSEQGYGEESEDQGAVAPPSNGDLTKALHPSFLLMSSIPDTQRCLLQQAVADKPKMLDRNYSFCETIARDRYALWQHQQLLAT